MPSKTPRVEVLDETTALLSPRSDDTSSSSSKRKRPPTPLPKLQIGILMLFQLAEPMTSHCIYVRRLIFFRYVPYRPAREAIHQPGV
jgi:hypothetical protein